MSIIAVHVKDDGIYLGADSIITSGSTQYKKSDAKIKKITDEFAFAATGLCKEAELFYLFCLNRVPATNTKLGIIEFMHEFANWQNQKISCYSIENGYLIVYKGKAYSFTDYLCEEVGDYAVDGAGRDFALATFHLGLDIEQAINAACELSIYCEKPIVIYKFNLNLEKHGA